MSNPDAVEKAKTPFYAVLRSRNSQEASRVYSDWAEKFDKHSAVSEFVEVSKSVARLCGKYVQNTTETTLLDVGAGTGQVAQLLRKSENFKGVIDILDGSMDMLYKAGKKDIGCRCIIQHLVEGDIPLPEQSYDVVVSAGAFLPNHLPVKTVEECVRLVKPNGFLILNDEPAAGKAYHDELKTSINKMLQAKIIALLECFEISVEIGDVYNMYVFKRCAGERHSFTQCCNDLSQ